MEQVEERASRRMPDLRNADLSGADLSVTGFVGAKLMETILRGADLSGASLLGAISSE